ncbi:MAG: type II toxin-antitoxin system mRNA interferase toxin, RelE/StbE family [Patescibacteria group bacterium]
MYKIYHSKKYTKSLKKIIRSGRYKNFDFSELNNLIDDIALCKKLDIKYQDHSLAGKMSVYRECHIKSDLLLVYQIKKDELILLLVNIKNHSNLF